MSFHIGEAPSSNKPPPPKPTPKPNLFPTKKTLSDGRTVWISLPQLDHLTIIVPIHKAIYNSAVPQDMSVEAFANGLGTYLKSEPYNAHWAGGSLWPDPVTKVVRWSKAALLFGGRQSVVHFSLHKKGGNRFRIDFNPRKLGLAGFKQLALVLGGANSPFDFEELIQSSWISRFDVAVDLVGVAISDVVAHHKNQGKRVLYVGAHGSLESIYINRKKPVVEPKYDSSGLLKKPTHGPYPAGKALLRIYDRVRERADLGNPPPFGPAPVTRVELMVTVKKRPLSALGAVLDPLKLLKLGMIWSQFDLGAEDNAGTWARYASLRKTHSHSAALSLIGRKDSGHSVFTCLETVPEPDLLKPGSSWGGWGKSLKLVGFKQFIGGILA